jgi:hypothetical protein
VPLTRHNKFNPEIFTPPGAKMPGGFLANDVTRARNEICQTKKLLFRQNFPQLQTA